MEPPVVTTLFADSPRQSALRYVFIGPGGLRPGWGLLLFIALIVAFGQVATLALHAIHPRPVLTGAQRLVEAAKPQTPGVMLRNEGLPFALVVLASWIMSKVERRPVGDYGLGGPRKPSRFLAGFLWGIVFLSILVGALWKTGLLVFDGRLLSGSNIFKDGAVWLLGFLLVGLLEEYLLRGYLQFTLSRGAASLYSMLFDTTHGKTLGFWTSAVCLSFIFGFGHGSNPGESPIGMAAAGLIGLILCLTLWRTGSLWWALGFHTSWDWAQSFLFGVADSGTMVQGHLFATHPTGKVLLSGGATGPEGSALILPLLVVIAGVVMLIPKEPQPTHL